MSGPGRFSGSAVTPELGFFLEALSVALQAAMLVEKLLMPLQEVTWREDVAVPGKIVRT